MWMHMTTLKVDPSNMEKIKKVMDQVNYDIPDELMGIEGYQLRPAGESDTFILLTIWESQEQHANTMQDEWYANLFKEKLMPLLVAPPERAGFHVLGHARSVDYRK